MTYSGIDMSEALTLASDFGHAASATLAKVDAVVEKGALNIKNVLVSDAESSGHYKHFSRAITYDRAYRPGEVRYEIGPDKFRQQGALGNILYFGTSHNGPVLDIEIGMRSEGPAVVRNLEIVGKELASGHA